MADPNSIFKPGVYRTVKPSDGFTDEERRMAKNLLQGDNLERLGDANRTGRKFRPIPVRIIYEFWWMNGSSYSHGGWRMDRVENGKRTDHSYTGSIEAEIARLKAAGFTVKEIHIDGAPSLEVGTRGTFCKRKPFTERFRNIGKVIR